MKTLAVVLMLLLVASVCAADDYLPLRYVEGATGDDVDSIRAYVFKTSSATPYGHVKLSSSFADGIHLWYDSISVATPDIYTITYRIHYPDGDTAWVASAPIPVRDTIVQANLRQMGGVTQSATDLKNFADAGYDPTGGINAVTSVKNFYMGAATSTISTEMLLPILALGRSLAHQYNMIPNGGFEDATTSYYSNIPATVGVWVDQWYCDACPSASCSMRITGGASFAGRRSWYGTANSGVITVHSRRARLTANTTYYYGLRAKAPTGLPTVSAAIKLVDDDLTTLATTPILTPDYDSTDFVPYAGTYTPPTDTTVRVYITSEGEAAWDVDEVVLLPIADVAAIASVASGPWTAAGVDSAWTMINEFILDAPHSADYGGNTSSGSGAIACSLYAKTGATAVSGVRIHVYNSTLSSEVYKNSNSGTDINGLSPFGMEPTTTYKILADKPGWTYDSLLTYQTITTPASGFLIDTIPMTQIPVGSPSLPSLCRVTGHLFTDFGTIISRALVQFCTAQNNVAAFGNVAVVPTCKRVPTASDGSFTIDVAMTDSTSYAEGDKHHSYDISVLIPVPEDPSRFRTVKVKEKWEVPDTSAYTLELILRE